MHGRNVSLLTHSLEICNILSFSTTAMFARTRLNVTLHVHCMSSYLPSIKLFLRNSHIYRLYVSLSITGRKTVTCFRTSHSLETVNVGRIIYRGADKSLARPGRKQATGTEVFEFHISYL
jgi:hypothetical protein